MAKPHLLVIVEGGIVQDVLGAEDVTYQVLDWDITEYLDEEINLRPESVALLAPTAIVEIHNHNSAVRVAAAVMKGGVA